MLPNAVPVVANIKFDIGILAMLLDALAVEPAVKAGLHHLGKGFSVQDCAGHCDGAPAWPGHMVCG